MNVGVTEEFVVVFVIYFSFKNSVVLRVGGEFFRRDILEMNEWNIIEE